MYSNCVGSSDMLLFNSRTPNFTLLPQVKLGNCVSTTWHAIHSGGKPSQFWLNGIWFSRIDSDEWNQVRPDLRHYNKIDSFNALFAHHQQPKYIHFIVLERREQTQRIWFFIESAKRNLYKNLKLFYIVLFRSKLCELQYQEWGKAIIIFD